MRTWNILYKRSDSFTHDVIIYLTRFVFLFFFEFRVIQKDAHCYLLVYYSRSIITFNVVI